MAFGFLFRIESLETHQALMFIGLTVIAASALVFAVRFSASREMEEKRELETALASRRVGAVAMEGGAAD